MEHAELIHVWKSQNQKIEEIFRINQQLLKENINQKAKSTLQKQMYLKTTGIVVGILYLIFLGLALVYGIKHYSSSWNYFLVSVGAIFVVNLKAVADYIQHLILIKTINYDGVVVEIQEQLSKLQLSIFNHSKTMCLQFPFYTTFYLSARWFPQEVGWMYILFQVTLTGTFTYLSYWLYKSHTFDNLNKKWFRNMLAGSGGKAVIKAMDFYKELEEFKNK